MADEPKVKGAKQGADAYLKSQGLGKDSSLGGMSDVPLSERKAVKVGGKGKKGKGRKNRQNAGGFDMGAYLMSQQASQSQGMQAILDAYTKSQGKQPMIRRNMDGSIVDQTKQPEGLDYFKKNNPYTEEAQQRKRNVNAENAYQKQMGMFEGYNAVQAKKAEQAAMGNQDPNQVMSKTVGGQKFVFDKQGNPVGMTGDNRVNPEGGRLAGSGEALTRNAFVDAMTKGDSKPQASKPTAQNQTQSQPQAKPAYQLPTMNRMDPSISRPRSSESLPATPTQPATQAQTALDPLNTVLGVFNANQAARTASPQASTPALGQRFDISNQSAIGGSAVGDFLKASGGMASPGSSTVGRFDIPMQASAGGDASGVGSFVNQLAGAVGQGMNTLSERTTMPPLLSLPQLPDMPNMPYQRDRQIDPNNPNAYQELPNWWDNFMSFLTPDPTQFKQPKATPGFQIPVQ